MKRSFVYILLTLFIGLNLSAQQKQLFPKKSTIQWTGKNAVTGQSLSGTLSLNSGSITLEDTRIIAAKLEVNMLSLQAENKELEEHLRAEDFFDVETFKTASFTLKNQAIIKDKTINAKGEMTIIGKTNEVITTLHFEEDISGTWIKGKIVIDRTKFGVYYDSPSFFVRLKEKAIADEFTIEIELLFQQ